ncbi:MAG: DUF3552 domain-containing protein [Pseudobdellovibrionaceae bacterium]|nr:MAG: DUF3552 domain-containing protein [Pseudobdellovibrionaceae bacterium]
MQIAVVGISFVVGFSAMWLIRYFVRRNVRRVAEREAQDILETAQWTADQFMAEAKKNVEEYEEEIRGQAEEELESRQHQVSQIQDRIQDQQDALEHDLKIKQDQYSQRKQRVDQYDKKVSDQQSQYQMLKERLRELQSSLKSKLETKADTPADHLKAELIEKIQSQAIIRSSKMSQQMVDEAQQSAERRAKQVLTTALNRFARPYCPERGTGHVPLSDDKQRSNVIGPERSHLKAIEMACGVDLVFDEEHSTVSVSGFDPVRRELGRLSVERISREKKMRIEDIPRIVQKIKSELFSKIRKDGNQIAKELGLKDLHAEIRNMMGALRYRYSFTQNQYFHCGEVGFLCGLLNSELGLDQKDGRRAGMLHDIGKSMDHSRDGGHAVIGADFIEQHGEAEHIVHAVRAHHYDETPSTDLAHLVIAADAISGARPGARRSTVVSYAQKMQDLQNIASSFEGVVDAHVVSAGREVRVFVDGRKVDDWAALKLSSNVAEKIENEMAYPGQIKVTVVRETQAVEYAK